MTAEKLTRQEVVLAYRLLLSRVPESEQTIERYVQDCSHEEALSIILSSEEFQSRLQDIDLRRFPMRAVAADRDAPSCMRRLEHLATLQLPVSGKSVNDAGAGLGLMSSYFLDRLCAVRLIDVSPTLVHLARLRLADEAQADNLSFQTIDLDEANADDLERRQVTICYDTLWQAKDIRRFLANFANITEECLVIETRCAFGRHDDLLVNQDPAPEKIGAVRVDMNVYPTRSWLWSRLGEMFDHVYSTTTQPNHADFQLDWENRAAFARTGFGRAVFVASRRPIDSPALSSKLERSFVRAP